MLLIIIPTLKTNNERQQQRYKIFVNHSKLPGIYLKIQLLSKTEDREVYNSEKIPKSTLLSFSP
jgi:hypothetical protein